MDTLENFPILCVVTQELYKYTYIGVPMYVAPRQPQMMILLGDSLWQLENSVLTEWQHRAGEPDPELLESLGYTAELKNTLSLEDEVPDIPLWTSYVSNYLASFLQYVVGRSFSPKSTFSINMQSNLMSGSSTTRVPLMCILLLLAQAHLSKVRARSQHGSAVFACRRCLLWAVVAHSYFISSICSHPSHKYCLHSVTQQLAAHKYKGW